eukprot:85784-Chlamydomonas_euryale.AAC.1
MPAFIVCPYSGCSRKVQLGQIPDEGQDVLSIDPKDPRVKPTQLQHKGAGPEVREGRWQAERACTALRLAQAERADTAWRICTLPLLFPMLHASVACFCGCIFLWLHVGAETKHVGAETSIWG